MRRVAIEPGLSEKQIEEFRQKLESRREDLRVKAGQVTREGREPMDWSPVDVADRAVSGITKEFIFQQAHEHHRLLKRVEAALARIRDGNFGECLACRELIGRKRLEAVPWTEYCLDCQRKRERGELADFNLTRTVTSAPPTGTGSGPNTLSLR
jgi:DnaK suppressor protein